MYEIGNVCDEKAIQYLMDNGVSEDTGGKLVEYIGSRIVYLESCVVLMQIEDLDAEGVCEKLFMKILNGQKVAIYDTWPESGKILNMLESNEYIVPAELCKGIVSHELHKVLEVVIGADIHRYTKNGHVTWHGRVQQRMFGKITD